MSKTIPIITQIAVTCALLVAAWTSGNDAGHTEGMIQGAAEGRAKVSLTMRDLGVLLWCDTYKQIIEEDEAAGFKLKERKLTRDKHN